MYKNILSFQRIGDCDLQSHSAAHRVRNVMERGDSHDMGWPEGAVGLALALQVAHHDEIDQETVGIRVSLGMGNIL